MILIIIRIKIITISIITISADSKIIRTCRIMAEKINVL